MNDVNTVMRKYDWWGKYQNNSRDTTSLLLEITAELACILAKLDHCISPQPLENSLMRVACKQVVRPLANPYGADDVLDTLNVVLAHFIPQRLSAGIAICQIVTMRYLNAHARTPMQAIDRGHLFARPSGFLNRRASALLAKKENIEGNVFWVPQLLKQKSCFALTLDDIDHEAADLRAHIMPQINGQFTVEQFGAQFVLCFETERDRIAAKMYLG